MPSMVHWNCSRTAHRGTASLRPTSKASPGPGSFGERSERHAHPQLIGAVGAIGRPSSVTLAVFTVVSVHATIGRSSTVVNTTGSSVSVRKVAARVPRGKVRVACAGDDR